MGPIGVLSLVPAGLGCHVTFHHWIISISFLLVVNFSVIQTAYSSCHPSVPRHSVIQTHTVNNLYQ
jgi:hypothetical protein